MREIQTFETNIADEKVTLTEVHEELNDIWALKFNTDYLILYADGGEEWTKYVEGNIEKPIIFANEPDLKAFMKVFNIKADGNTTIEHSHITFFNHGAYLFKNFGGIKDE